MDSFYDENFRRQLAASTKAAETISNAMKPTIQQIKILNEAISPLKINSEYARRMTGAINKGLPSPYLLNEIKNVNRRNDYLTKNLNPLINSAAFESYTKTLQTMRAFSTKNNYIFRQWSKLQKTTISTETIEFLVNKENTKQLSESFNISEDIFTSIQDKFSNYGSFFSEDIIDQTRNSEDTNQIPSHDIPIKNHQKNKGKTADYQQKLHDISPLYMVWLFVVLLSAGVTIDGIVTSNIYEAIIGTTIDHSLSFVSKPNRYKDEDSDN